MLRGPRVAIAVRLRDDQIGGKLFDRPRCYVERCRRVVVDRYAVRVAFLKGEELACGPYPVTHSLAAF